LAADTPLPAWAAGSGEGFLSITHTADELSIVCRQESVPDDIRCERGWRCVRVAGTLDLALLGVLASLLAPLADAGVAVFVVSTFDTDSRLVQAARWAAAISAWRRQGHHVESA